MRKVAEIVKNDGIIDYKIMAEELGVTYRGFLNWLNEDYNFSPINEAHLEELLLEFI